MRMFGRKRSSRKALRRRRSLYETLEIRRVLATYFVDSTVDDTVGSCVADTPGTGTCTLRLAVQEAEANAGADTIQIADGTYLLNNFGSIDTTVGDDLSFVGNVNDRNLVVIDAAGGRGFDLFGAGNHTISFSSLTIQNGVANDGSGGGAINANSDVNLVLDNVTLTNNTAAENLFFPGSFSSGGAIQASGNLTITNSSITNNSATRDGGGIAFGTFGGVAKTLDISNSTITGNNAGDSLLDRGYGGGIRVEGSDATAIFNNVVISDNTAGDSGGGAYVSDGSVSVGSSQFNNNDALGSISGGGGLYVLDGTFSVTDTNFDGNTSNGGAAGFESFGSPGTINGGEFQNNVVNGSAGPAQPPFEQGGGGIGIFRIPAATNVTIDGVYVHDNSAPSAAGIAVTNSDVVIDRSTIEANQATSTAIGESGAGGIGVFRDVDGTTVLINRSRVLNNVTAAEAGGVGGVDASIAIIDSFISGNQANGARAGGVGVVKQPLPGPSASLLMLRTTVSNNTANLDGGGIGADQADMMLTNVTVTGNTSQNSIGGGIAYDNSSPSNSSISFSTIAGNTSLVGGSNLHTQGTTSISVDNSIFDNGTCNTPNTLTSAGFNIDSGTSCGFAQPSDLPDTDPLLGPLQDNGGMLIGSPLAPGGLQVTPTMAPGVGSPAIDNGDSGAAQPFDARMLPRPVDGDGDLNPVPDIGAIEVGAASVLNIVVDENSDIVDGDFTPGNVSLREAILQTNANPGLDTITFGGPFTDATPDTIVLGGTELVITDSLTITGPGSTLLSISGNNASRVLSLPGASDQVNLSGLTITGGRVVGANGGGISNNAVLTLTDSIVTGNTATNVFAEGYGGGIDNSGTVNLVRTALFGNTAGNDGGGINTSGVFTAIESSINNNVANSFGGGVANFSGTTDTQNSSISGNSAGDAGGGIFNSGGTVTISDSSVNDNIATDNGGGIYSYIGGNSLRISSSTISGNAALNGGGIAAKEGRFELINSTVSSNTAADNGGGILVDQDTAPTQAVVIQSTIALNISDLDNNGTGTGGGIFTANDPSVTTSLFNSLVTGNIVNPIGLNILDDVSGRPLDASSSGNLVSSPFTAGGLTEGTNGNLVGDGLGEELPLAQILDPVLNLNGGSTFTHALVPGSRAINNGINTLATTPGDDGVPGTGDANEALLNFDQRGPGFPRILNSVVDIGAFEAIVPPNVSPADLDPGSDTGVSNSDNITSQQAVTLNGTADPGSTVEIFDRVLPIRRVTFDPATDFFPDWDPASETIAFTTTRAPAVSPVSNVGLVQSDGTGEMNGLISPNSGFGAGTSPNWIGSTGRIMVAKQFGIHEYASFDASAAPTSTLVTELIVDGGGGGGNIVISRDGSTALWRFSDSGGSGNIFIRTAPVSTLNGQSAATHGTLLQQGFAGPTDPQFFNNSLGFALSPDGSQYVIAEPQPQGGGVFGYDLFLRSTANGSLIRQLTTSGMQFGGFNGQPEFSPDGTRIAFTRSIAPLGVDDLFVINTDGTGLTNITNTGRNVFERMPSWAPDGARMAFAHPNTNASRTALPGEADNWNVYVIEGLDAMQPPGASLGATVADAAGNWSITTEALREGDHKIVAVATNGGGVSSLPSDPLQMTIDTTAPAFPSVPNLVDASDTGPSNNDDITSDTTPTFDGTSEAGSLVEFFDGNTPLGSTTVGSPLFNIGDYLVADLNANGGGGALIAVDPATGNQTVISSGGNFVDPVDLSIGNNGEIFVADRGAPAIIQVDPFTGAQTVIAPGAFLVAPSDVVQDASGNLLIADRGAQAVTMIDSVTGNDSIISSGNNISVDGLRGITLDPAGNILVTDAPTASVIRIDPTTGSQTIVSSGNNLVAPHGITVDSAGLILVADPTNAMIVRIDPDTGEQTVVSSGDGLVDPVDVAVDGIGDLIIPELSGTLLRGESGQEVLVTSGGNFAVPAGAVVTRRPLGMYTFTSGTLNPGAHNIAAIATDVAGNVSGPVSSATPLAVTIQQAGLDVRDSFFEESTGTATIVVTLTIDAGGPFTVDFTTADGTATAGNDYTTTSGQLNFDGFSGEQQSFTVPILDDTVAELDEQFQIILSNPTASIDVGDVGLISLFDDDSAILTVKTAQTTEDMGTINFDVVLTGETDGPFTVNLSTADGAAVAGQDYTATSNTLTFNGSDGEVQTFSVPIQADNVVELDESFSVFASGINAGTRDIRFDNIATRIDLNIIGSANTQPAGDVSIFTPNPTTRIAYVADDAGLTVLDVSDPANTIQLGSFPLADPAFALDTPDVTFFSGIAYVAAGNSGLEVLDASNPASITRLGSFSTPGQTALSIGRSGSTVFLGETDGLNNGTVRILDVSDPANINQLALIQNGLPPIDAVIPSGNNLLVATENGLEIFDVSIATSPVSLGTYTAREGIAVESDGTTAVLGTPNGVAILDVSDPTNISEVGFFPSDIVTAIDFEDSVVSFTSTGFGTDGAFSLLDISAPNAPRLLGSIQFDLSIGVANSFDSEGSTIYVATERSATGGIQILDGDLVRDAQGTILNDDTASLSINNVTGSESSGTFTFDVTLDSDVDTAISVDATTMDLPGGAVAGLDYIANSATINFAGTAGETQPFTVTILSDAINEPDETFAVDLSNVQSNGRNVQIATSRGIGTIQDVVATADLNTTISDNPDPVNLNNMVTFTVTVTNQGPDAASNVISTTTLPAQFAINSATSSFFNANVSTVGNDVTMTLPALDSGITATLTITATAISPGTVSTITSVTADQSDPDSDNNDFNELTTILGPTGIQGQVTCDLNGDGIQEPLPGVTVFLDTDGDRVFDPFNQSSLPIGPEVDNGTLIDNDVDVNVPGFFSASIGDGNEVFSSGVTVQNVRTNELLIDRDFIFAYTTFVTTSVGTISLSETTITQAATLVDTDVVESRGTFIGPNGTVDWTATSSFENGGPRLTSRLDLDGGGMALGNIRVVSYLDEDVQGVSDDVLVTNGTPGQEDFRAFTIDDVHRVGFSHGGIYVPDGDQLSNATYTGWAADQFSELRSAITSDSQSFSVSGEIDTTDLLPSPDPIFGTQFGPADVTTAFAWDVNAGASSATVTSFLELLAADPVSSLEVATTTDSNGFYSFSNVGTADVTVVAQVPFQCETIPSNPAIARSVIGVGDLARSIAHADADNDGDVDLWVASDSSNSVSLLINNQGSFSFGQSIGLGERPQSIATWMPSGPSANPFVAVAGIGTPASGGLVYTLDGSGLNQSIPAGDGPVEVAIDDFDNNGIPDIVVATLRTSDLRVLMNGSTTSTIVGSARLARTVTTGDLNQDGNADLVVGGYSYPDDPTSELVVRFGDGMGSFGDPLVVNSNKRLVATQIINLANGMNNAMDTRLLALSESGTLVVYGLIDGEVVETNRVATSSGATAMDFGDFTRDGILDVAIANLGKQQIDVFVGNGQGDFKDFVTISNVPAPSDLTVADFDNDGVADIAVANLYQDANLGQQGSPDFELPSTTTILRLDAAENTVSVTGGVAQVDFAFATAKPTAIFDTTGEGEITARDALQVINALTIAEGEQIENPADRWVRSRNDVNGDGYTSAIDALMIINRLAVGQDGLDTAGNAVVDLDMLNQDTDEKDRVAAVDLFFGQLT